MEIGNTYVVSRVSTSIGQENPSLPGRLYWINALANYSKSPNWWKELGCIFILTLPLTSRLDNREDTRRG
jgi:hypothetical protein